MTTLELVDTVVHDRVLVYGSLPPAGKDLDLLVRPAEHAAIRESLLKVGFIHRKGTLARFRPTCTEAVELTPAESWGLPRSEQEALFAQAQPIDTARRIVRPGPGHALLISARRAAHQRVLSEKLRARVEAILAEHPDAWQLARVRAPAWRATWALRALEAAYVGGGRMPAEAHWRCLAEHLGGPGTRPLRVQLRALRSWLPRPRRARIVTFSGIDGAGKTTQAGLLRDALKMAGHDAVVIWKGIGSNALLDQIKLPVKRCIRRLPRRGPWAEVVDRVRSEVDTGRTPLAEPGNSERRRGFWLNAFTHAWATIVAGANVVALRQLAWRESRRGRIVIFDRYTLDSAVVLRHFYGDGLATRLLTALIHRTNIRPIKAYLLDAPPQIAFDRKGEWGTEDLECRAALYRSEYARLGVRRLDATRPTAELAAEIAADVWCAL